MEWEERVRTLAHRIWEGEGRPDGKHIEHWEQACREIDSASDLRATTAQGTIGGGPAPPTSMGLVGVEEPDLGIPDRMDIEELGVGGDISSPRDNWPTTGRSKLVGT